jgi:hypothetical protein
VHFTLGTARAIELSAGAGPDVRSFAVPGQLNVFCVAEELPGGTPSIVSLRDDACPDGMSLVHSAGHFLGFGDEHPAAGVMSECGSGTDRAWVPSAVAEVVNP